MQSTQVTFSFGKNWQSFIETISEETVRAASEDIDGWLGRDFVKGKTVLDIGCGSGIHSLVFHIKGAKEVLSFDVDPCSVAATQKLWGKAGQPSNWKILAGSILDRDFVGRLGKFDIVYSWGVLHHTGAMWEAIENASTLVENGGTFWIALYKKGQNYKKHLNTKIKYNAASDLGKKLMVARIIALKMVGRALRLKNPLYLLQAKRRGMNSYHNLIDWLGGLPYEVASEQEITSFLKKKRFCAKKIEVRREGSNNIYLFSAPG